MSGLRGLAGALGGLAGTPRNLAGAPRALAGALRGFAGAPIGLAGAPRALAGALWGLTGTLRGLAKVFSFLTNSLETIALDRISTVFTLTFCFEILFRMEKIFHTFVFSFLSLRIHAYNFTDAIVHLFEHAFDVNELR